MREYGDRPVVRRVNTEIAPLCDEYVRARELHDELYENTRESSYGEYVTFSERGYVERE